MKRKQIALKYILFSVLRRVLKLFVKEKLAGIPGFMKIWKFLLVSFVSKLIDTPGGKVYFDSYLAGDLCCSSIFLDSYEPFTTEIFKRVVKKGNIVVDLGANIGYYSLLAARIVGMEGKVYAFEPEPRNHGLLLKNIELNKYSNIIPVQKAVSNKSGATKLFISTSGGHSIHELSDGRDFVEVETVTLDEFLKEEGHHVDVIKIDVEGAEIDAIEGMKQVIKENRNLKMFVEFWPYAIRKAGKSPEEFFSKLLNHGFVIYGINEKERELRKISNPSEALEMCKKRPSVNLLVRKCN